jgi:hypothetical protein
MKASRAYCYKKPLCARNDATYKLILQKKKEIGC